MKRVDVVAEASPDIQIGHLLAALDGVTSEWREELGDISEESIVWQPFQNGHSIGALILHMADVEAYWLHEVGAGQARPPEELKRLLSDETDQYEVQWPTPPDQPLSWYYAQQDAVRARSRQLVSALSSPERLSVYENREFTLRWLLNHVIYHEAYHSGQIVLLSLMTTR